MRVPTWFKVAVVAMGLGALPQAHSAPITVDQENVAPTNSSGPGGLTNGQSFTPTLTAIDAAEFLLRSDGASSTLHLEVRQGQGLTGTLLGSSGQVTIGGALSEVHFDLLSTVSLLPGNLYTLVLALDSGDSFAGDMSTLNPYAGGLAINNSNSTFSARDFWFREGTHEAQVPVPATLGLLVLGLAGVVSGRRRMHPASA